MFKKIEKLKNYRRNEISLKDLRNKMSNRLFIGAFLITFLELILLMIYGNLSYKMCIYISYLIVYGLGFYSLLKDNKFSYNGKGYILLAIFYCLGSLSFVVSSGISSVMMYTFGIIVSSIHLKKRVNMYYIAAVIFTLSLLSIVLSPTLETFMFTSPSLGRYTWLFKSMFIGLYIFTLYASMTLLITYTKASIKELEKVALYDSLTKKSEKPTTSVVGWIAWSKN